VEFVGEEVERDEHEVEIEYRNAHTHTNRFVLVGPKHQSDGGCEKKPLYKSRKEITKSKDRTLEGLKDQNW
jgi:uncharacterized protein YciI